MKLSRLKIITMPSYNTLRIKSDGTIQQQQTENWYQNNVVQNRDSNYRNTLTLYFAFSSILSDMFP